MDRKKDILNGVSEYLSTAAENKKIKAEEESPEMELMEYKQELAEMNLASLRAIYNNVKNIMENAENPRVRDNLTESWLQGKISVAEDYLSTIHDFLMYTQESDDTLEAGEKPGLWENIRKKKQREGKSYKPAKPGDKDRPDPKQWEKLTSKKKPKIGDVDKNFINTMENEGDDGRDVQVNT